MNALGSTWNARKTELELPEEINLQLEVANVGSRTLAILVDLALCGIVLFIVYSFTVLLVGDRTEDLMTRVGGHAGDETLIMRGRAAYGQALAELQKALLNEGQMWQDQTLAASCVLGLYEVCTVFFPTT